MASWRTPPSKPRRASGSSFDDDTTYERTLGDAMIHASR